MPSSMLLRSSRLLRSNRVAAVRRPVSVYWAKAGRLGLLLSLAREWYVRRLCAVGARFSGWGVKGRGVLAALLSRVPWPCWSGYSQPEHVWLIGSLPVSCPCLEHPSLDYASRVAHAMRNSNAIPSSPPTPTPTRLRLRRPALRHNLPQRSLQIQILRRAALAPLLRPVPRHRQPRVLMPELGRIADIQIHHALGPLPPRLRRVAEIRKLAPQAVAGHAAEALQLVLLQPVERGLEVVEDDRVREALEDEGQLPEGVDAVRQAWALDDVRDGQDVDEDEGDADEHGAEEDGEAGGDAHQLDVAEFVARLDVVEEREDGEDPPGVAEEGFVGARVDEEAAVAAEIEAAGLVSGGVGLWEGEGEGRVERTSWR